MSDLSNIEQQIDAYFNGQLSVTDEETLMSALEENPELKEKFEFARDVFNALRDEEAMAFEEDLSSVIKSKSRVPETPLADYNSPGARVYMVISSVAAVVLIASVIFGLFKKDNDPQQLFASYYQTYPVKELQRSDASEWQKSLELYANEDYDDFIAWVKTNTDYPQRDGQFYLAIAHMEEEEFHSAKSILNQLSADESFVSHDAVLWYLALTQLKLDEIEAAKENLEKLSQLNGVYARNGIQLLNNLEK